LSLTLRLPRRRRCGRKPKSWCSKAATRPGPGPWSRDSSATAAPDDVAYKPYDHGADYRQRARDYLDWEVALLEQIKRDPAIRFRTY
jgi:hypothetical protein